MFQLILIACVSLIGIHGQTTTPTIVSVSGCTQTYGPSVDGKTSTGHCPPGSNTAFTVRVYGMHTSTSATYPCANAGNTLCTESFTWVSFPPATAITATCSNAYPKLVSSTLISGTYYFTEDYSCVMQSATTWRGYAFAIKMSVIRSHYFLSSAISSPTTVAKTIQSDDQDNVVGVLYANIPTITTIVGCGTSCPTQGGTPITITGTYLNVANSNLYFGTRRIPSVFDTTFNGQTGATTLVVTTYNGTQTTSGEIIYLKRFVRHTNPSTLLEEIVELSSTSTTVINFLPQPRVTSLSGCTPDTGSALAVRLCQTSSVVTFSGTGFLSGSLKPTCVFSDLRGNVVQSTSVISATNTVATCQLSFTSTTSDPYEASLLLNGEYSVPDAFVAFVPQCPSNCGGHGTCVSGDCVCTGTATSGYWKKDLSGSCTTCLDNYFGSTCLAKCSCGGGLCNDGVAGTGACTSCLKGFAGTTCSLRCPTGTLATDLCFGHGTCDDGPGGTGTCTCTSGFDPPRCNDCSAGRYGASCASLCPTGGLNSLVCSGKGTCFNGINGNGTCLCNFGYSGTSCSVECQGGAANPCSGHGICNVLTGQCTCNSDSVKGFWSVNVACGQCKLEYSNSTNCVRICPGLIQSGGVVTAVCNGHGSCREGACTSCVSGYCGLDCSKTGQECLGTSCPFPSQYGADCSKRCPGSFSLQDVCSGRGTCSNGVLGSGLCFCQPSSDGYLYSGADCSISCAKCGKGVSCDASGACQCTYGTGGPDCTPCPRTDVNDINTICGGVARGKCVSTPTTRPICACEAAFYGSSCQVNCPEALGGIVNPCSGHGQCTETGCQCFQSATTGFWTGTLCDRCKPPFLGTMCTDTCPGYSFATGTVCSGHGSCDSSLSCTCYHNDTHGFWVKPPTEPTCSACDVGYWGPLCVQQCQGGACNQCFGHGVCSQGVNGTGLCVCSGNFGGIDCQSCKTLFYGRQCSSKCTAEKSSCSGHGRCNDGVEGDGECLCSSGYSGTTCGTCNKGYYSLNSLCSPCPGTPPCSGHGSCALGSSGPICACDSGFVGSSCGKTCPTAPNNVSCNGFSCKDDGISGTSCVCPSNSQQGYFTGRACERCITGWTGTPNKASCSVPCPGGVATPCSLSGQCLMDGTCLCDPGYVGDSCQKACPGPRGFPCNGHGTCTTDATCTCYGNATHGYWGGQECKGCLSNYRGADCTKECKKASNGLICNGMADCNEFGECRNCVNPTNPKEKRCGPICEQTGEECVRLTCNETYQFGVNCDGICLGVYNIGPSQKGVCNGHGNCSNGVLGNGLCSCEPTWVSSDCAVKCKPCVNGKCDPTTGDCICTAGWAGSSCSLSCPLILGLVCGGSNRGTCFDGNQGNGTCACKAGYAGTRCHLTCPCKDGTSADCEGIPCNNHGVCSTSDELSTKCDCFSDSVNGYFTGKACDTCVFPYELPSCTKTCAGIITSPVEQKCSGHGRCLAEQLRCECDASPVSGFWSGTACQSCATGYYGSKCTSQCPGGSCRPCNGNGNCTDGVRGDGKCKCSQDLDNGFWTGESCNQCFVGYWGRSCKNVCPRSNGKICSGRGDCDSGTLGTGLCKCSDTALGHWGGADCSTCKSDALGGGSYYGKTCIHECPKNPAFRVCSSLTNSKDCFLEDRCQWYQNSCVQKYCSGHGRCLGGVTLGSPEADINLGKCECKCDNPASLCERYVGQYCELLCPLSKDGLPCSGHGLCSAHIAGTAVCNCTDGYQGAICASCAPGYWGSKCDLKCSIGKGQEAARCATNDTVCSNFCSERSVQPGCNSADGSCTCISGYAGPRCEIECSPSKNNVCFGRGSCQQLANPSLGLDAGRCKCFADCVKGYWDPATNCSTCLAGYAPPTCTQQCPEGFDDTICSNHGLCVENVLATSNSSQCVQAKCSCEVGRCNGPLQACEVSGNDCSQQFCDLGAYGPNCEFLCPSTVLGVCNKQGTCDHGKFGTGVCTCYGNSTFIGPGCNVSCPRCLHGSCVLSSSGKAGMCKCTYGWGGTLCDQECPGGATSPCTKPEDFSIDCVNEVSYTGCVLQDQCQWIGDRCLSAKSHGVCNSETQCRCFGAWTGSACQYLCPGAVDLGNSTAPCSNNGECILTNELASCVCKNNTKDGHWAGESCSECSLGWAGTSCTEPCPQQYGLSGIGYAKQCKCGQMRFGDSCGTLCPGLIVVGNNVTQACYGHGTCSEGWLGNGECLCFNRLGEIDNNPAYFVNCSTYCVVNETCMSFNQINTFCSSDGQCTCKGDKDSGFWKGTTCDECSSGYWGDRCNRRCNCNNHGDCDRNSGKCSCYRDPIRGFWDGLTCSVCYTSYVGLNCDQRDVKISLKGQVVSNTAPQVDPSKSFTLSDDLYGRVFVGSNPFSVFKRSIVNNIESTSVDPDQVNLDQALSNSSVSFVRGGYFVDSTRIDFVVETRNSFSNFQIVSVDRLHFKLLSSTVTTALHEHHRRTMVVMDGATNGTQSGHSDGDGGNPLPPPIPSVSISGQGRAGNTTFVLVGSTLTILFNNTIVTKEFSMFFENTIRLFVQNEQFVVLYGNRNQTWEIVTMRKNNNGNKDYVLTSLQANAFISSCETDTYSCINVVSLTAKDERVYAVFEGYQASSATRTLILTKIDLNNRSEIVANVSAPVVSGCGKVVCNTLSRFIPRTSNSNSTAMIVDLPSSTVFVAINDKQADRKTLNPSTLYKFNVDNLDVSGSIKFQSFQGEPEVITSLEIVESSRTLLATPSISRLRVLELMLFAVKEIHPKYVSREGGTPVTIIGEGFTKLANTNVTCGFCRNCDSSTSQRMEEFVALNISNTQIVCQAPPYSTVLSREEQQSLLPPGADPAITSAKDPSCLETSLEISLFGGRRYTRNDVLVYRTALPVITGVSPTEGVMTQSQRILITGTGFVNSTRLMCGVYASEEILAGRLPNGNHSGTGLIPKDPGAIVYATTFEATYIDSFSILCIRPKLARPTSFDQRLTYVSVSLDGWVFGRTTAAYNVTGSPKKLLVNPPSIDIAAAGVVTLPTLRVQVADETGHYLYGLKDVNISYTIPSLLTETSYNGSFAFTDANPFFKDVFVVKPKIGTYIIPISYLENKGVITIHVLRGEFAEILFSDVHATFTDNINILNPGPIVKVTDSAGNDVVETSLSCLLYVIPIVTVQKLEGQRQSPEPDVPFVNPRMKENAGFLFNTEGTPIRIEAIFGETYMLQAVVRKNEKYLIANSSILIRGGPCPSGGRQFQKIGTKYCLDCPEGATCDGYSITTIQNNRWRYSNMSLDLYTCHNTLEICVAINATSNASNCARGYRGPLCSLCVYEPHDKWGKVGDQCGECPSDSMSDFIITCLVIAIMVMISFVIHSAISATERDETMVLVKMFINHVQLSSQLGRFSTAFPILVRQVFSGTEQASSVNGEVAALTCRYPHNYYSRFVAVMALPVVIPACAIMYALYAFAYSKIRPSNPIRDYFDHKRQKVHLLAFREYVQRVRRQSSATSSDDEPGALSLADVRLNLRPEIENDTGLNNTVTSTASSANRFVVPQQQPLAKKIMTEFVVVCVTMTFLIYITLVQHCANMLKCNDYWETDYYLRRTRHSYLSVDQSIDCLTSEYDNYFKVSVAFLAAYGLGMPLAAICIVVVLKRIFSNDIVKKMFTFMMTGYKSNAWFWESTVLIKKMGIVVIISFVSDIRLQTFVGMWFLTIALVLHLWKMPYKWDICNKLESFSLTMIVCTLNLGLLYEYSATTSNEWYFILLTVVIMAMVFIVMMVFLYFIFSRVKRRITKSYDIDGDGDFTWEEFRIMMAVKTRGKFGCFPLPKEIRDLVDEYMQVIESEEKHALAIDAGVGVASESSEEGSHTSGPMPSPVRDGVALNSSQQSNVVWAHSGYREPPPQPQEPQEPPQTASANNHSVSPQHESNMFALPGSDEMSQNDPYPTDDGSLRVLV